MADSAELAVKRAAAIRELRKKAGLTQQQLAKKCLVDRTTIVKAEKTGDVSESTAFAIGVALGRAGVDGEWSDKDILKLELLAPVASYQNFDKERSAILGMARSEGAQADISDFRSLFQEGTRFAAVAACRMLLALLKDEESTAPQIEMEIKKMVADGAGLPLELGFDFVKRLAERIERDVKAERLAQKENKSDVAS